MHLTVVSRFLDGDIDLTNLPWRVMKDLTRSQTDELLRESQILLLPTHGDTFGFVLTEAMAAGCCVLSSNREPQDWILDYGAAGILVEPSSPSSIGSALARLIMEPNTRLRYALKGFQRFNEIFFHRSTGSKLHELFRSLLGNLRPATLLSEQQKGQS